MKDHFIVVKTTFPDENSAKDAARLLVERKLAACVSIVQIESFFMWQEEIKNGIEFQILIKTKSCKFKEIKKVIEKIHPYKIPQIFSQTIDQISEKYSVWLNEEIR